MKPLVLDQGVAPDVAIVNGLVYVAYGGTNPMRAVLVVLTLQGMEIKRVALPNGFDQSFPRFSGPWLVYRQDGAHGFAATAVNVLTGQTWVYGPAGATFGLTVNQSLGLMAYEWRTGQGPWQIWFGGLADGARLETAIEGAPDGLDQILSHSAVTLRKDTRGDVPGIWYPVQAGYLTVGELRDDPPRPGGGIGVQLAGEVLRVALQAENTPDPRCATDGTVYAIVCWNPVRLLLGTAAELRALPPANRLPGPMFQQHSKGLTMEIDGKTVILRGPAGKLASPDGPNTGTWGGLGTGWRGVAWQDAHATVSSREHRATKLPNGNYTFTSLAHNGLAGADATKHSGAITEQFYYKPDGNTDAGGYEQWRVYDGNENGAIEAQIEYSNDEGKYFSCPLAVEIAG